jgi:hypothetical protein
MPEYSEEDISLKRIWYLIPAPDSIMKLILIIRSEKKAGRNTDGIKNLWS